MHGILPQIGISLLAATTLGFIFQYCRQPVILGYLVAGALAPQATIEATADEMEQVAELKSTGPTKCFCPIR